MVKETTYLCVQGSSVCILSVNTTNEFQCLRRSIVHHPCQHPLENINVGEEPRTTLAGSVATSLDLNFLGKPKQTFQRLQSTRSDRLNISRNKNRKHKKQTLRRMHNGVKTLQSITDDTKQQDTNTSHTIQVKGIFSMIAITVWIQH